MPDARWSVDLEIVDGLRVRNNGVLTVEAYDRITVTVPAAGNAASTVTVQVQPGGTGQVQLLVVAASDYDPPLSYIVDGAPGTGIALDAPLYLVGAGAISLLGATQKEFKLTNTGADDVVVDIVVGRDATA